jgi:hypothetical protein
MTEAMQGVSWDDTWVTHPEVICYVYVIKIGAFAVML